VFPDASGSAAPYPTIISNSLLHHLHDPRVLWAVILRDGAPGADVFVMDLCRPESPERVAERWSPRIRPTLPRFFAAISRTRFTPRSRRRRSVRSSTRAGLDVVFAWNR
jgi:hypothetical protein